MEVYLLFAHLDIYNELLIGVYHTEEDAKFHREEFDRRCMEKNGFVEFDEYNIQRRVIGARAFVDRS